MTTDIPLYDTESKFTVSVVARQIDIGLCHVEQLIDKGVDVRGHVKALRAVSIQLSIGELEIAWNLGVNALSATRHALIDSRSRKEAPTNADKDPSVY